MATLGLSRMDAALFMLTVAGAADPAIGRVFGYLLDVTEAADPTPLLAATLFVQGLFIVHQTSPLFAPVS